MPVMFEKDNSRTRELQALQSFAVNLDVGFWSGDKRVMELGECHTLPLITMLRRRDRFRGRRTQLSMPTQFDDQAVLDEKWHHWIEVESWKRLAFHVFIQTQEVSIAYQVPPLISYAEITLDLPARKALWQASTAQDWRRMYLETPDLLVTPSFVQCIWSVEQIGVVRNHADIDMTNYLVLLSHWTLVFEYRQLDAAQKAQTVEPSWSAGLIANSKCRELRNLFEHFQNVIDAWGIGVPRQIVMVTELMRMYLCVSIEDLQLLAGKEGEEQARRVYPTMKAWHQSADSRVAIWHAGQILRASREGGKNAQETASPLTDFAAVVVYHAGVCLWVYGLLSRVPAEDLHPSLPPPAPPVLLDDAARASTNATEIFFIEDACSLSSSERNRFIALNQSLPAVRSHWAQGSNRLGPEDSDGNTHANDSVVPVSDPERCMTVVIATMIANSVTQQPEKRHTTALVRNLIQLLDDLGAAAAAL
jgi:hypothetical protein